MKKSTKIISWIGVAFFAMMAVYALSQGGLFGALLFILGGALIAPLGIFRKLRGKLKLNKALSIILAVIFLFAGALATPATQEPTDNNGDSQISSTVSDDTSNGDKTGQNADSSANVSSKEDESSAPDGAGVGTGNGEAVSPQNIPPYSGKPFVTVNNNIPQFSASELKTVGYETYSSLDSLGRTRTALASVGRDTMPKQGEERGSISSIKPSGWRQAKYDCISGGWLYNRCHLIGWQLSAENANSRNLITGTKYLNINGMLPFENMVADYIKETGNHVAYRITPIYEGNNLLASGVQMEAYSVEDNGGGICFNVYCYNVQPDITINYATGVSSGPSASNEDNVSKPTSSVNSQTSENGGNQNSGIVYITATGEKYHSRKNCSGLSRAKNIYESSLSNAKAQGLDKCSKCY